MESITDFQDPAAKCPAWLIIFPDEGHWILKGESNKLHIMDELLAWLKLNI
jgi:dipeptidyl aminopeptidase/acylaminoacyl peptidase